MLKPGEKVRYVGRVPELSGREGTVMSETIKPGHWCVAFGKPAVAWFVREKHLMPLSRCESEPEPDSMAAVTMEVG